VGAIHFGQLAAEPGALAAQFLGAVGLAPDRGVFQL
jgi:hypothetical protein